MSKCKSCAQYKKDIEKLKEELAYIRFELEELRSKRYKSGRSKPPNDTFTPSGAASPAKKRGGLFGHIGWFRKKPKEIDRIDEVRLDRCPECGSKDLTECANTHEPKFCNRNQVLNAAAHENSSILVNNPSNHGLRFWTKETLSAFWRYFFPIQLPIAKHWNLIVCNRGCILRPRTACRNKLTKLYATITHLNTASVA